MQCDVILRTCDRVYTVHESSRGAATRVGGSKLETIEHCINSLVRTMNATKDDLRLIIVDDHSSDDAIEVMTEAASRCRHMVKLIHIAAAHYGNGRSMRTCYEWARDHGNEYLYFVEDDYLHDLTCIPEMLADLELFRMMLGGHEVAMNPCDNPDNYMQPDKNKIPSFIAMGSRHHWRTVSNSTATFLCSKAILKQYWYLFDRMADYGDPAVSEDNTINKIWQAPYNQAGGAYMVSPIPSLALHLHFEEHLSPFIDWKKWWENSKVNEAPDVSVG